MRATPTDTHRIVVRATKQAGDYIDSRCQERINLQNAAGLASEDSRALVEAQYGVHALERQYHLIANGDAAADKAGVSALQLRIGFADECSIVRPAKLMQRPHTWGTIWIPRSLQYFRTLDTSVVQDGRNTRLLLPLKIPIQSWL